MPSKRTLIAMAAAGALLAAGGAMAQGTPVAGISTTTTYFADATIGAIDPGARTVTLAFGDGTRVTRKVADVVDLGRRKVGDIVSIGVQEKLTFVVTAPGGSTRATAMSRRRAASPRRAAPPVARHGRPSPHG